MKNGNYFAIAGITESGRDIYLTTEASPNLTRHSERPDLYGNSHRTGHDSQPAWGSVMTQMDIASNLWDLVHNDTGHGEYYNDLDMLQVGRGDFDVRTGGADAFARSRSHFTQHVMLKSTLLLSTVLSELPSHVTDLFLNKEAIAIHQDLWGKQARRVSSVRPAVTDLVTPFNAWMVVRKCEKGNPRQVWHHIGGEPGVGPSAPGRLWTTDEKGKRWCAGEGSWARAAEVMPCDDRKFWPNADDGNNFGCNLTSPCSHKIANFTAQLGDSCIQNDELCS